MIPTTKAVSIMIACLGTSFRAGKNSFMIPAATPASMAIIMMYVNRMNLHQLCLATFSATQPNTAAVKVRRMISPQPSKAGFPEQHSD